jgi:adenylosuccinate lyase
MERTLDDSANRRLVLPQAFLAIDAVLSIYQNVATGLIVYPAVIAKNLNEELPFMITENVLMEAVAAGGDRQHLHEVIRQHSQLAAAEVKQHGRANDLIKRLQADPNFASVDVDKHNDASSLVGRAPQQVDEFLHDIVDTLRAKYGDSPVSAEALRV